MISLQVCKVPSIVHLYFFISQALSCRGGIHADLAFGTCRQRLRLTVQNTFIERQIGRMEQPARPGDAIPSPRGVSPRTGIAQSRPGASSPHGWGDISYGEADPPVGGPVLAGGVEAPAMMQRHFAGAQRPKHRLILVDIGNLLATRQQIVVGKGVMMRDKPTFVAARQKPYATGFDADVGQGDPGRRLIIRLAHAPIGDVLMPGHRLRRFPVP